MILIGCAADIEHENAWLTQDEIAIYLKKSRYNIATYQQHLLRWGAWKNTSLQKMHKSPNAKKSNYRPPIYYNLDVIVSVGYRVKSQRSVLFKRWANKILKD